MNNEPKLCPLMCMANQLILGNICQRTSCMWFDEASEECAVTKRVECLNYAIECIRYRMPEQLKPIKIATMEETPERVTWRTATACPECNSVITSEKFCPYCGKAIER